MSDAIFAAFTTCLISGAIALAIFRGQMLATRSRDTMELLRELHSKEMSECRSRAQRFVLKNISCDFDFIEEMTNLDEEEMKDRESLFILTRFFTRLNLLAEAGMLRSGKTRQLFGPIFGYWWGLSFEHQLINSKWRLRKNIASLYHRISTEAQQHGSWLDDWQGAVKDGIEKRQSAIKLVRA